MGTCCYGLYAPGSPVLLLSLLPCFLVHPRTALLHLWSPHISRSPHIPLAPCSPAGRPVLTPGTRCGVREGAEHRDWGQGRAGVWTQLGAIQFLVDLSCVLGELLLGPSHARCSVSTMSCVSWVGCCHCPCRWSWPCTGLLPPTPQLYMLKERETERLALGGLPEHEVPRSSAGRPRSAQHGSV